MKPYYADDLATLYHGDCRELLPYSRVFTVAIADPPYGETSLAWDIWPEGWLKCVADAIPSGSLWCFGSMRMFLKHGAEFSDWRFAQDVVWQKQNGTGFADDRFRRVHESVTHWYRGEWSEQGQAVPRVQRLGRATSVRSRGQTPHTGAIGDVGYVDDGTRLMLSVIHAANMQGRALHPTEKPAAIVRPLLEYSWVTGDVLDPFCGSGVVLVEAKALGIPSVGIERNERYCELAAQRLSQNVLDLGGAA